MQGGPSGQELPGEGSCSQTKLRVMSAAKTLMACLVNNQADCSAEYPAGPGSAWAGRSPVPTRFLPITAGLAFQCEDLECPLLSV